MATILRIVTGVLAAAGMLAVVGQVPADEPASTIIRPASQPASKPFDFQEARNVVANYAKKAGIKDIQPVLNLGNNVALKLTLIPPGEFVMGSPKEEQPGRYDWEGPQHEVVIGKPFYMGVYEVTQEQYQAIMGRNPSNFRNPKYPVEQVGWEDIEEFCKKLSQKTEKTFRLPTEAEWEYACRAGSKTRYFFGDSAETLGDYAWHCKNSKITTYVVGQKNPNPWGLYDILGNVWEWCSDYFASYEDAKQTYPIGKADKFRVMRGGCRASLVTYLRSAFREGAAKDYSVGFRIVMEIKKP
ncbi:MAG: formylglycine-generating enzyme family protein [Planctomycetes bacterium]|nr:formylglycine-generating enzyme family protein [Planctomycetota bacterium]